VILPPLVFPGPVLSISKRKLDRSATAIGTHLVEIKQRAGPDSLEADVPGSITGDVFLQDLFLDLDEVVEEAGRGSRRPLPAAAVVGRLR